MIDKNTKLEHVAVVCHAWYGDMIGGSFRLASEFAEHLADAGIRVSYICCDVTGSGRKVERIRGVEVRRYRNPSSGIPFTKIAQHIRGVRQIVSEILTEGSLNAVAIHSPLQGFGAMAALKRSPVPVVYTVHSPFDDEILSDQQKPYPPSLRLSAAVATWMERKNLRAVQVTHVLSEFTRQRLLEKYGSSHDKCIVLSPGWVDVDKFAAADGRDELRNRLGGDWETPGPIFFTLRRLHHRMGLDTLVDACCRLSESGKQFRCLIGGSGPMREELQRMIGEHHLEESVKLLGRVPEDALRDCYAAADCFVLPTRSLECFGLIVLEAMACNTPVIASRAAAIPELAAKQGEEWMFEPGDSDELAERMRAFLDGELPGHLRLIEFARSYQKEAVLADWTSILDGVME